MKIVIGGFLGYAVGVGVGLLAHHFVSRYRSQPMLVRSRRGVRALLGMHGAISPLAAITQAGMGLLGACRSWRALPISQVVATLVVTGVLVTISLVDLEARRIPNGLCLMLALWALVQVLWLGRPTPGAAALGMLVGGGLFLLVALAEHGAMGAGDVKSAAALGAVLGYPLIIRALFWGIVAAGGAALVLLATRRVGRKEYMAYGPYLALGAWLTWMGSLGLWP